MISNMSKLAVAVAVVTGLFLAPGSAPAAPVPIGDGACCSLFFGCCGGSSESLVDGVGGGFCEIRTEANCNGIGDTYKGDGTTCEEFCPTPTTTSTTLPEFGACCHLFNGCCGAPSELQVEGGGSGECRMGKPADCNGIADTYKGDGTTCEEFCPITTTTTLLQTTTTTLPLGACCQPAGTCLDVTEQNCVIGNYQGNGTECATVECPQPTTTTLPETTTTTVPETTTTTSAPDTTTTTTEELIVLCGDANADDEITTVDALIALKTSVGTAQCSLRRCDYNGNAEVQTSDALAILRVSVGQPIVPMCPLL